MKVVLCGCSKVILKIDDGKKSSVYLAGECDICMANDGNYTLSPSWQWSKMGDENEKSNGKKAKGRHDRQARK